MAHGAECVMFNAGPEMQRNFLQSVCLSKTRATSLGSARLRKDMQENNAANGIVVALEAAPFGSEFLDEATQFPVYFEFSLK